MDERTRLKKFKTVGTGTEKKNLERPELPRASRSSNGGKGMSTWIVNKGRWTQEQMNAVCQRYHTEAYRTCDGINPVQAEQMTPLRRFLNEATIVHVVEALEANGFSVTEADHKDTTEPPRPNGH